MPNDFIDRIKDEIADAQSASDSVLFRIDRELAREPTVALWILRGDAIQVSSGDTHSLEEAKGSYLKALELDPTSAEAYESLGYFTFAVDDDARGSLPYFQRAIELGAGESAREGLRDALDELAGFSE